LRALGIPRPIEERSALRLELADQLQELELTDEGAIEASQFRAAPIAAKHDDPAGFLKSLEKVKAAPKGGWVGHLQSLVQEYAHQDIPGVILDFILALGLEMQAVRTAIDKIRLGAITSELQQTYKCHSLVCDIDQLADRVDRISEMARAA